MGGVAASSGVLTSGTWSAVDVTSLVAGNGQLSVALTGISSTAFNLQSRQAANPPQLVVTFAAGSPSGLTPTSVDTSGTGAAPAETFAQPPALFLPFVSGG